MSKRLQCEKVAALLESKIKLTESIHPITAFKLANFAQVTTTSSKKNSKLIVRLPEPRNKIKGKTKVTR